MGRFDNEILAKEKEKLCNSNSEMPLNEIIQIEEELNYDIKILNTLNKLYDSIKPTSYGSPSFEYNGHLYTLVMTKCTGKKTKYPYKFKTLYKDHKKVYGILGIRKELGGMYSSFLKLGSAFYEDNPSMTVNNIGGI